MATNTITFTTTAAQNAKIKEAMEWRADRQDSEAAPHTLSAQEVADEVRSIALRVIKHEVKSDLADKRLAAGAGDDNVDEIQ